MDDSKASGETRRSLPSRERGLKCSGFDFGPDPLPSLPSRERGLKSRGSVDDAIRKGRSLHGSVD